MRVIVFGATGFIGNRLIHFLRRDCEVVAYVRNPERFRNRFPDVEAVRIDISATSSEMWREHLRGAQVVVNTVGIFAESGTQTFQQIHVDFPRNLFVGCRLAGVQRIIHISALGADSGIQSRYYQSKHITDTFLRSLPLQKVIVKPSFVYGTGGASMRFFRALSALPLHVLPNGGNQLVQPIHVDDLAAAMCALVMAPGVPDQEVDAVGPQPITVRDMLGSYRRWLGGRPAGVISLPMSLAILLARVSQVFGNTWLSVENLRMLQQGNTGDSAVINGLLKREPLSLEAGLAKSPATEPDRWHARLYFIVPLLRYALAFMWIFAGLTSAFLYPIEDSVAMLGRVGLRGDLANVALYGAATFNVALGIAVAMRFKVVMTGVLQLGLILVYTVLISLHLPELWLHPFGPIVKNIPILIAILILTATDRR